MSSPNRTLRLQVIKIYKGWDCVRSKKYHEDAKLTLGPELLFLIRDYPLGYDYARPRLHRAFMSQAGLEDQEKIKKGIQRAEFVKKGK